MIFLQDKHNINAVVLTIKFYAYSVDNVTKWSDMSTCGLLFQ